MEGDGATMERDGAKMERQGAKMDRHRAAMEKRSRRSDGDGWRTKLRVREGERWCSDENRCCSDRDRWCSDGERWRMTWPNESVMERDGAPMERDEQRWYTDGERWRTDGERWRNDEKDGAAMERITMGSAAMAMIALVSAAMGAKTIVSAAMGNATKAARHFTQPKYCKITGMRVLADIWNNTGNTFVDKTAQRVQRWMADEGIRDTRSTTGGQRPRADEAERDDMQDFLDAQEGGEGGVVEAGIRDEAAGRCEPDLLGEEVVMTSRADGPAGRGARASRPELERARREKRKVGEEDVDVRDTAREKRARQTTIDELQWIYTKGLPFNAFRGPEFQRVRHAAERVPRNVRFQFPSYRVAAGAGIPSQRGKMATMVTEVRAAFRHTGATILSDGRKSHSGKTIVNFLAGGANGALLYATVARDGSVADTAYVVYRRWRAIILFFPAKDVIGFRTDSTNNYTAAARRFATDPDADIRRITWLPYSTHVYNLMLSDFGTRVGWVKETIIRARALVRFIKSHGAAFALFRRMSPHVTLVEPVETQFASVFLMLTCLKGRRDVLESMLHGDAWAGILWERRLVFQAQWVQQQIRDGEFWRCVNCAICVMYSAVPSRWSSLTTTTYRRARGGVGATPRPSANGQTLGGQEGQRAGGGGGGGGGAPSGSAGGGGDGGDVGFGGETLAGAARQGVPTGVEGDGVAVGGGGEGGGEDEEGSDHGDDHGGDGDDGGDGNDGGDDGGHGVDGGDFGDHSDDGGDGGGEREREGWLALVLRDPSVPSLPLPQLEAFVQACFDADDLARLGSHDPFPHTGRRSVERRPPGGAYSPPAAYIVDIPRWSGSSLSGIRGRESGPVGGGSGRRSDGGGSVGSMRPPPARSTEGGADASMARAPVAGSPPPVAGGVAGKRAAHRRVSDQMRADYDAGRGAFARRLSPQFQVAGSSEGGSGRPSLHMAGRMLGLSRSAMRRVLIPPPIPARGTAADMQQGQHYTSGEEGLLMRSGTRRHSAVTEVQARLAVEIAASQASLDAIQRHRQTIAAAGAEDEDADTESESIDSAVRRHRAAMSTTAAAVQAAYISGAQGTGGGWGRGGARGRQSTGRGRGRPSGGYGSNMLLCRHIKGLYDGNSRRLPPPVEYLDLALKVPKDHPVLPREYVFRLLTAHEGSSSLAQETPVTLVGHGSVINSSGGLGKGHARNIQTEVGPEALGNTTGLHSPHAGTHWVGTPKTLKVVCEGDTYSIRDEKRREAGRSGQEVGGNEAEGMGAVRDNSGGEPTSSENKRERQKTVREEVAEQTRRMKRMKGHSKPMIGGDEGDVGERASGERSPGMRGGQEQGVKKRQSKEEGATTTKKARRPNGLTIHEEQAMGKGDSARLGIAAAREPSDKSKRKLASEEGDGQKKPRRRKTAEGTTGSERAVGRQYNEAATFNLEYERNDDGEIVEKDLSIQLFIDPRRVCDIPPWERYYNHRSFTRDGVLDIKGAMVRQFHEEKGKIWTKNPLVLAPIYKSVMHKPERAKRVHKDVFKPEDKDKYFYYPVNGQYTVAAVKELANEAIFELWKMHSWPARVVWFSDEDFGGYLQMPLVTADDDVFHKDIKFYDKWAERELLGGNGKTPLSKPDKYMPDKSLGFQAIPEMGSKGAAGETKMGSLVQVPPPPTKNKTQAGDKFFVVVKDSDMFCWQCLADMTDAEKLSILDDIRALRGVFVQSTGGSPKRQQKPGIKDMVATRKVNRMMLRMFHYILFLESEEDAEVWRYGSPLFRTQGQLLAEFGPQGLTKQVWVELRKHFQGAVEYVNTCKRTLPYEKESLDETKRMYDDDRFPKSFEKSVRSILRLTEEEVQDTIRVSEDMRHIKWHKLNQVTSLIPFGCPPSQAHSRLTEICEIVRYYVCNLYVLDLCDPTLLSDWQEDDFASLQDRNLVFGVLNGYHDAPRKSVSNFLKRLEHVFFLMAKPLTLENFKAQFNEEDTFDAEDMEEMSDSETFHFESMPLPRVVAQVGDEGKVVPRRYSTSPAGLKRVFERETVEDQSSDDGEEEIDYDYEPSNKLARDHDTWENERLFFYRKHHRFTPEDVWGHNIVWHPRKFQPAVKTGKWVMAMKEADGKWSSMNRLGAGPFKRRARDALVEHLTVMNPDSRLPDVNAYAGQKLDELYVNNMLEFRAHFYAQETAPSRVIDWRMPQPPSGGQHPGGGGGGDEGDGGGDGAYDSGSHGGGDGGDGSGSVGRGEGGDGSRSAGKGSRGKGLGGKGSGGKGSGGKGSAGKGSGGKGSGGKRRAFRSRESMDTDSHYVGSRDSDMRDEAALKSYQLRVDSHLSARTLFPDVEESSSHRTEPTSPVHNTLLLPLLEEGERLQHMAASPERQNHS
ncbi:hypothetical protein CBR_g23632 [Chara braunii]|uniref:DUF659 domain-containing protein n=1 Tax=Chara braunii TaxID=69332 RepID=A0A388L4Y2_CHABU|nr:hypothetical protein CBR_g23632 [Chara braunii]|eukprot:GBG77302.1 hypothetical protein CBR_g23632 [Chara braunii]